MAKRILSALKKLTSLAPVEFAIGKATLVLTVDEATDIVTATAGDTIGAAYSEFKFGVETGVYGDIVRVPQNFTNYANATGAEMVYAVCRNVAADGSLGAWSDEASVAVSVNNFLTFSFPESEGSAVIDAVNHTVAVNVAALTDPSALVAAFTVSDGATVLIGEVEQESETTENDFTAPVVYTVKSQAEVEQAWTITVTVLASAKAFTAFSLPGQVGSAVINTVARTVAVNLPDDADPSNLVATFAVSAGATVDIADTPQESAVTANDFTNPVVYTITGADTTENDYNVTVTVLKDAGKALTAFSLPGEVGAAVINEGAHTVAVAVPHGTDVSALVATFTVSAEAAATVGAVAQESGVTANDFSAPVTYRVTAEDLSFQDYVVTVTVNASTNDFTAFSVPGQEGEAVIDAAAHTVAVNVPHEIAVTALVATFGLTAGASAVVGAAAQESGVTANDFSAPVVYTVTGADAAEQAWTVTITVGAATNNITAFSFAEQTGAAVIDPVAHTVAIEVAALTEVDSLVATFALTAGASAKVGNTVQVSGDTLNDFTAPVVYAVTGATEIAQAWTVTVSVAA